MGKSWKRKDRLVPCQQNDYKWSSQSYTLKEILNNFKLPIVVQCRQDTVAQQLKDFFFDLRQPLLLHSKRSIRKVFARCVRMGPGGTMKELLPEVVIPEDYAGWFKVSKGLSFTKPVPYHNIEDVADCPSDFFLCTTQFHALVLSADSDSDASDAGHSRIIAEGEVLRKEEVQPLSHTMIPQRFKKLAKENKFLLCIDERDMEVYIPVGQTGLFYEVSDGNLSKSNNCVLQILDILDEMIQLPLYVRHILGDPPPVSQFYSPCLKLHRLVEEETIMGCTLDREDLLPFEIQTDSSITFEISLNTQKLLGTVDYVEALGLCKNIGNNYVTDMKLAVTFSQVGNETTEVHGQDNAALQDDDEDNQCSNNSSQRSSQSVDYDRQSEDGEVDAQSEFTIQWDPGPRSPEFTEQNNQTQSERESECDSIDSFQNNIVDTGHACTEQSNDCEKKKIMKFWEQNPCPFENITNTDISTYEIDFDNPDLLDIPPIRNPVWTWEESSYDDIPRSEVKTMPLHTKNDLNIPTYYDADSEPSSLSNITIESTSFRIDPDQRDAGDSNNSFELQLNGNAHYSYTGDVYMNLDSDEDNVSISDISTNSGPSRNSSSSRTLILTPSSSQSQDIETSNERPNSNPWLELERQRKKTIAELNKIKRLQEEETERKWSEFCFERTLSLPHKTKSNETKGSHIREKHSNSWEQVSPRGKVTLLDMSVVSAGLDTWTPRSIRRYNSDCANYSDKSQLISDTSSEESTPIAKPKFRTVDCASRLNTKEDNMLFLADMDRKNLQTTEYSDNTTKSLEAHNKKNIIAQILLLKDEMKKNTFSEWNEVSEII